MCLLQQSVTFLGEFAFYLLPGILIIQRRTSDTFSREFPKRPFSTKPTFQMRQTLLEGPDNAVHNVSSPLSLLK